MKRLISQILIFSLLLQPLMLLSPVFAETVNMEYSDPQHLHAPKAVNSVTYQYDENGNLTSDGERTIEWNQDNLPTKITKDDTEVKFFYDANGQRIAKETKKINTGETSKTIYVNQYYQQSTPLRSFGASEGQATKYYFAQGRRIAQRVINNNNNLTIQQFSNLYFLHHDYLGSTVLATDSNSQPLGNSLSYFPYGSSVNNLTIQQFSNYLFTGQEKDPESDLYNYNARLYSPKTGVFISADTVEEGNRYAYAGNNPIMFTDPTGHYRTGNAGKPDYTIDKIPIPPWIANNKDLMFKIRAGAFILSSLHPLVDITVTDTHIIVKRLTGDVAMMAMAGQLIGMTGGIQNVGPPSKRIAWKLEDLETLNPNFNKEVWSANRQAVYEALAEGDSAISLFGGRRIGKTELMLDITEQQKQTAVCIDFQLLGWQEGGEAAFYEEIGHKLTGNWGIKTAPEVKTLINERLASGESFVLMFDEAEYAAAAGYGQQFTDFIQWSLNQGVSIITSTKDVIWNTYPALKGLFTGVNLAE